MEEPKLNAENQVEKGVEESPQDVENESENDVDDFYFFHDPNETKDDDFYFSWDSNKIK